jgi:hypothetical protein
MVVGFGLLGEMGGEVIEGNTITALLFERAFWDWRGTVRDCETLSGMKGFLRPEARVQAYWESSEIQLFSPNGVPREYPRPRRRLYLSPELFTP